jgi:hypothetical protein
MCSTAAELHPAVLLVLQADGTAAATEEDAAGDEELADLAMAAAGQEQEVRVDCIVKRA